MADYNRYATTSVTSRNEKTGQTGSQQITYLAEVFAKSGSRSTAPINGKFVLPTHYRASHLYAWPIFSTWKNNQTGWSYSGGVDHQNWYAAQTGICYGCVNTWPYYPNVPAWVQEALKHKLNSNAANQDFNLAQSLGEAPETVAHIVRTGARVLSLYRAVRSGNFHSIRRNLKKMGFGGTVSGGWLEYQYAWKPLLADMYAASKVIADGLKEPVTTVKATVIDDGFRKPAVHNYAFAQGRFARGATGALTFKVRNYLLYDLNSLGLLNPWALAWELFPLSFAVDWILHIGGFLESLSVPIALDWEHGYETLWVNNLWFCKENHPIATDGPKYAFKQKAMIRTPYGSYPFALPYLRLDLNLNQVISLMALARQAKRD